MPRAALLTPLHRPDRRVRVHLVDGVTDGTQSKSSNKTRFGTPCVATHCTIQSVPREESRLTRQLDDFHDWPPIAERFRRLEDALHICRRTRSMSDARTGR